jgi:branched-chain amino acid transport system substrate-binding protein
MRYFAFPLAALLLASIIGCGEGDKPRSATTQAADTIKIGEYGSMTGNQATFGTSTHKGVVLALKEINDAGGLNGRKFELISYDTRGQATEAGNAVTRLCTQDKVTAVIGEVASSLSLAGGAVAQKYGVPMISPSSTNDRVTKIGNMIFRVCFIDEFQGYVVADFCIEKLKAKKVAVLYDQSQAYSKGLQAAFIKSLKELGGEVTTIQTYTGSDPEFGAQLTSIRDTNPDAIFIPGYYTEAGNIAVQARKLGITVPLLGGDGWESEQLTKIGGKAIEGCYFSNHYSPEEARHELTDFIASFKRDNKEEVPDAMAALGYDATRVLFDSMKRAKSLSGDDLAAAIATTKHFSGVTGVITINKDRNADKNAVMLEIKNGEPHFVASIPPPGEATDPTPTPATAPAPAPAPN